MNKRRNLLIVLAAVATALGHGAAAQPKKAPAAGTKSHPARHYLPVREGLEQARRERLAGANDR